MLNLPAGLINSDKLFKFELSNKKLMRLFLGQTECSLNNIDFLGVEKKLADLHYSNISEDYHPYCVKTNSLIKDRPMLLLLVPIYGDSEHKNIFIFGLSQEVEFIKEEILHYDTLWHYINNPLAILMLAATKIKKKDILDQNEIDYFFSIINNVTERINRLMCNMSEKTF